MMGICRPTIGNNEHKWMATFTLYIETLEIILSIKIFSEFYFQFLNIPGPSNHYFI
jgi:hypothetical protein